jgi:uracil-DNA glycosylase
VNDLTYPFGRRVTPRNPSAGGKRELFVLGAYPSALHVRWQPKDGKAVAALPVDDEPEPFWNGADAEERVAAWKAWLQPEASDGTFTAPKSLNGPSGTWVDDNVLAPLNTARKQTWITDCLDTYRMSTGVEARIEDTYNKLGFPACHIEPHPSENDIVTEALAEHSARLQAELARCRPATIVTLGNAAARVMADLLRRPPLTLNTDGYGAPIDVKRDGRTVRWFPFAHPAAPERYQQAHTRWITEGPAK